MITSEYLLAIKIVITAENKLRLQEKEQEECFKILKPEIRELENDILAEIFGSYAFLYSTPQQRENARTWWDCR